jgi:hypothetical protein
VFSPQGVALFPFKNLEFETFGKKKFFDVNLLNKLSSSRI